MPGQRCVEFLHRSVTIGQICFSSLCVLPAVKLTGLSSIVGRERALHADGS
jgi:hypothetical protein